MRDVREYTLLDAVEASGASTAVHVLQYNIYTFQITADSITDGATLSIEASLDGDNWALYETYTLTADGTQIYTISKEKVKYVRANLSSYTDGTYTVLLLAGV
jgi:hypothetical protein